MKIDCASATLAQLGEGALWDVDRHVVWWLDIRSATLYSHDVRSGQNRAQVLESRLTALGIADDGQLVACGDRGFVRVRIDSDLRASVSEVIQAPTERAGNRFNDGKVDAIGRFWAGTMDDAELTASGALYCLEGDGQLATVRTGMGVPNGPCFLSDGTMLITDSSRRHITAVQFDERGAPTTEREFARFSPDQGCPDGMTVDAADHVWIAFWDGWCVRRVSPTGEIVAEISVPVQRPTCPAFGGTDLNYLYLTTARTGIPPDDLVKQPLAGSLLRLEVGVQGLNPGRYGHVAPSRRSSIERHGRR